MHHVWSIFLYPLDSWHYLDSQGDILFLSDGLCGSSCDTASRTAYMLSKQLEHGLLTPVGSFPKAWCAHPRTFPMPFGWSEFVAHFVKVYTMVKIPRFFFVKKSHALVWGMVDPSPTNYFQQKKSLKMSELDPLKKHFLECEQCSAACFSFFLGGWNFAETFRYVSTKESQKVFFLQTRSPPIFFWRARQRQTWCCFFKVNCRPLCVRVGNVALVRVKYRSEATSPQNYPTFSFCFLVGRISSPRKSTGGS